MASSTVDSVATSDNDYSNNGRNQTPRGVPFQVYMAVVGNATNEWTDPETSASGAARTNNRMTYPIMVTMPDRHTTIILSEEMAAKSTKVVHECTIKFRVLALNHILSRVIFDAR